MSVHPKIFSLSKTKKYKRRTLMKSNMITNFDINNLNNSTNLLDEVLRDGARKMLQTAID